MSQYDIYEPFRNPVLSVKERHAMEEAVKDDAENAQRDHSDQTISELGYTMNGNLILFETMAAHITIATDRANAQFAGYPPMPEDPDLTIRFPGIDPVGKYSVIDMKFAQREATIRARLQSAPPEVAATANELLDKCADSNSPFYQAKEQMKMFATQHRTFTRGSKLCLNPHGSKLLAQHARELEYNMPVERYDTLLQGIEYIAGVKEGPVPQEVKSYYEEFLQTPIDNDLIQRNQEKTQPPAHVDIQFENFDHTLVHHQFCSPHNWGKTPAQLKEVGFSVNLVENLVTPYASATVRRSLNPLFQQAEEMGHSRAGLTLIDGKPASQLIVDAKEKGQYARMPEKEIVNQLVAGALMAGKRVETYLPDANGKFPQEPTQITKSGYEPTPVKQVVMSGWQRFCSKLGFYKELTAQKDEYDKIMAGREQMRTKLDHLEKGTEEYQHVQPLMEETDLRRSAFRDACFGDLKANPLRHTGDIRTDRTAHYSFCMAHLAEQGHSMDDIMNPDLLQAEKRQAGDHLRDLIDRQDVFSYAKTMAQGGQVLFTQMDEKCHQQDMTSPQVDKQAYATMITTGAALFDIFQENSRETSVASLTQPREIRQPDGTIKTEPAIIDAEALSSHHNQMFSAGQFANSLHSYTSVKTDLYQSATKAISPMDCSTKAINSMGSLLGSQYSVNDMRERISKGESIGSRNALTYGAVPTVITSDSVVRKFANKVASPDHLGALSQRVLSGAVEKRFDTKVSLIRIDEKVTIPTVEVTDKKQLAAKQATMQRQDGGRTK